MGDNNGKLKSNAKAIGLKSTLLVDNSIVLTSFVNQSTQKKSKEKPIAHIEKITDSIGNIKLDQEKMFKSDINSDDIKLKGYLKQEDDTIKEVKPIIPNPVRVCDDYIGIKSDLEQMFFDKEHPNDNIHIQIAYNIYDIKKILTLYINNIIFAFENLGRENDQKDSWDYIGMAVSTKSYEVAKADTKHIKEFNRLVGFLDRVQSYGDYFPGMFKTLSSCVEKNKKLSDYSKEEKEKFNEKCRSYNFQVIRALCIARQIVCHAKYSTNKGSYSSEYVLFNLETVLNKVGCNDVARFISGVYSNAVDKVNNDFKKNSKNNLYMINKVMGYDSSLVEDYYRYNVLKEQNAVGINTKHIREIIYDNYFNEIKDKSYDTDRSKLNTVLTFILLREIETGKYDKMVDDLRSCQYASKKESIYQKYARLLWDAISNKFYSAKRVFDDEKIVGKFKNKMEFSYDDYKGKAVSNNDTDMFIKLIYFTTRFLDGKEINELICAMINKFDNISELIQISKLSGLNIQFAQRYKLFNSSRTIADSLRTVKNIAQMKPEPTSIKEEMIADALKVLNCKDYELKESEFGMLVKDGDDYKEFHKVLYEKKKDGKADHQMLNFIINNVIKSRWFSYIIKYNNPSKCALVMKNKSVLSFVINDIPESQITRYYQTITGLKPAKYDEMKTAIIDALYNFSVDNTIKQIGKLTTFENKQQDPNSFKGRSKAIINLYLTVAYLITKSMVKVNSRFEIALACLDRDTYLVSGKECKDVGYLFLIRKFISDDKPIVEYSRKVLAELKENKEKTGKAGLEYRTAKHRELDEKEKELHFTKRWYDILFSNFVDAEIVRTSCVTPKGFDFFDILRDKIAHVNVISALSDYICELRNVNSYYELYCAVIQRVMTKAFKNNPVLLDYFGKDHMEEGDNYSKDFVWMMNFPFAYNLARYKNLSNEYLFYDKDRKQK